MPRLRNPGLQAKRAALAWNRTRLAGLVNALLTLRSGWVSGIALITALSVALWIAAAAATLCGAWRRQHLLRGQGAIAAPAILAFSAAVATLVACVAAVLCMLAMHWQMGPEHIRELERRCRRLRAALP
jgi:hypothetical protein